MLNVKKVLVVFCTTISAVLLFLSVFLAVEFQPRYLDLYVFDIGQGDSILITTPAGYNILIDGGPDNKVVYKLGKYLPFYDREIDLVILSHPHADHLIGLVEVAKRYKVTHILVSGVEYNSSAYSALIDLTKEKNINLSVADGPKKIIFSDGSQLYFIFPDRSFLGTEIENLNNSSIVAKLVYGQTSALLTGDFEKEENLVGANLDLKADILKVGHHGSSNANDAEFLKAVSPTYALISSGAGNKFKHPHRETLQNLIYLGVEVYRTDLSGDLHFRSNGTEFMPAPDLKP